MGLRGRFSRLLFSWVLDFLLGVANVVVSCTARLGVRESYKAAFWFGTGCAGLGLLLFIVFVDVGQAKSAFTADEKKGLEVGLS
jgi:hypothetical protein